MLNLVLYQPDIPQNLGACLRLSACLGARLHVVEPCGFPFDHAKLRRAGMDYIAQAEYIRHLNWDVFLAYRTEQNALPGAGSHPEPMRTSHPVILRAEGSAEPGALDPAPAFHAPQDDITTKHPSLSRLLLLETDGAIRYTDFAFAPSDYVVIGSEGAGTPRDLYAQMDATLTIPMRAGVRSLNMAMSAGILLAEACRQRDWDFLAPSLRAEGEAIHLEGEYHFGEPV